MDTILKKNLSYLLILQNFNYIIPLLLLPYLTQKLGVENFGKITFVQAFISYFILITDYGFNTSSVQKVVAVKDDKIALSRVFWSTTISKLLLAIFSFLIVIILLNYVSKFQDLKTLIKIASIGIITSILFPVWLFQGLEKMQLITLINVIPRIIVLFATFLLVKEQNDYQIALELQIGGAFFASIASAILIWHFRIVNLFLPSYNDIKHFISDGWYIFFAGVATNIYTTTNTVVLGLMTNNTYVGLFAASEKIIRAIISILSSISQVTFPRINIYFLETRQKAIHFSSKLISILLIITLTGGIVLFITAPLFVKILFGLPQYENTINILRISSLLPLFSVVNGIIAVNVLLTFGLKKEVASIVTIGGIFSLLLIVPSILLFQANGVAACALLTEILILILLIRQLKKSNIVLQISYKPIIKSISGKIHKLF
jgi:PST family polysaccharide transporter